jgi:hypothetical protein
LYRGRSPHNLPHSYPHFVGDFNLCLSSLGFGATPASCGGGPIIPALPPGSLLPRAHRQWKTRMPQLAQAVTEGSQSGERGVQNLERLPSSGGTWVESWQERARQRKGIRGILGAGSSEGRLSQAVAQTASSYTEDLASVATQAPGHGQPRRGPVPLSWG